MAELSGGSSDGGHLARRFVLLALIGLSACTRTLPGPRVLRPGTQVIPTAQVVDSGVVTTLGGVVLSVTPLDRAGIQRYFKRRGGLDPFAALPPDAIPPFGFLIGIRNRSGSQVQFDPGQVLLVDQDDRRLLPILYDQLYQALIKLPDAWQRVAILQRHTLNNLLVLQPGKDREGLLFFPELPSKSKAVLLEIASFYAGGEGQSLLFAFLVEERKAE